MLYREIIAVCSQIHTKHINTLCGQHVGLFTVKPGGTHSDQHTRRKHYTTRPYGMTRLLKFMCENIFLVSVESDIRHGTEILWKNLIWRPVCQNYNTLLILTSSCMFLQAPVLLMQQKQVYVNHKTPCGSRQSSVGTVIRLQA